MPNKNYLSGRRFEYATMERWKTKGYACARTAGSHGFFDVIAVRLDRKPELIQCKVVEADSTSKRLLKSFKESTIPSSFYHQVLEVKVKGSTTIQSVTV